MARGFLLWAAYLLLLCQSSYSTTSNSSLSDHDVPESAPLSALVWTEDSFMEGSMRVVGVSGDPSSWLSSPRLPLVQVVGQRKDIRRQAMGFDYRRQKLYVADSWQSEIESMTLDHSAEDRILVRDTSLVFTGTSSEVGGIAVDWLSNTIYWTDKTYNWISMAAGDKYEIYRHIVTTDLHLPGGICVHPMAGLLFWVDYGSKRRLESSNLDGSNRRTLISNNIGIPRAVTVDYDTDKLYWIDDLEDEINWSNLDGTNRQMFSSRQHPAYYGTLRGISVYHDYIFTTDRYNSMVRVFNKTSEEYIRSFPGTKRSYPIQIAMFAEDAQPYKQTECESLGCDHMCISLGGGRGRCMCGQGFDLESDNITCQESSHHLQPSFMYTVGQALCRSEIRIMDSNKKVSENTDCFHGNLTHAEALSFDAYAELLFYSDTSEHAVIKKSMAGDLETEVFAMQTGIVRGMAVDWITHNVYWTDEQYGTLSVAKHDATHSTVLLDNLNSPRGLVVDPRNGVLYWAAPGAIYRANMDGTNQSVLVDYNTPQPDGMELDIIYDRIYWTDREQAGVNSIELDGTYRHHYNFLTGQTFRDVTVYQGRLACTDGTGNVYFGSKGRDSSLFVAVRHTGSYVSHDIITYSKYLQPQLNKNACSHDNGGCDQLCLVVPDGRTCTCSRGFHLASDGITCASGLRDVSEGFSFLMITDPYRKQAYQMDLTDKNQTMDNLQAISMPAPGSRPALIEYGMPTSSDNQGSVLWYDSRAGVVNIRRLHDDRHYSVDVIHRDADIWSLAYDEHAQLVYYMDEKTAVLHKSSLLGGKPGVVLDDQVIPNVMALDKSTGDLYWARHVSSKRNKRDVLTGVCDVYRLQFGKSRTRATKMFFLENMVRGMTVDMQDGYLYFWTEHNHVMRSNMDGSNVTLVLSDAFGGHQVTRIAVTGDWLYFASSNSRSVWRSSLTTGVSEAVTEPIFYQVTDLKLFTPYQRIMIVEPSSESPRTTHHDDPGSKGTKKPGGRPTQLPSKSSDDDNMMLIIIGAVPALVVVVLVVIVLVVIVRHRRSKKRKPDELPSDLPCHENPTYMTSAEMQAMRVWRQMSAPTGGAGGGTPPGGVPAYPEERKVPLPDDPEDDLGDLHLTMQFTSPVRPVPEGAPTDPKVTDVGVRSSPAVVRSQPTVVTSSQCEQPAILTSDPVCTDDTEQLVTDEDTDEVNDVVLSMAGGTDGDPSVKYNKYSKL